MVRRTGLRVVLFAAFTIAATAGAAAAQGTLEGAVRDDAGQPVEGVRITIAALDVTGLTDVGGAYRITGIAAGSHEVRFTRIGYGARTLEASVADGGPPVRDGATVRAAGLSDLGRRVDPVERSARRGEGDPLPARALGRDTASEGE